MLLVLAESAWDVAGEVEVCDEIERSESFPAPLMLSPRSSLSCADLRDRLRALFNCAISARSSSFDTCRLWLYSHSSPVPSHLWQGILPLHCNREVSVLAET